VTQSGGSTAVTEGGATDTVSVVLSKQPTANVSVTVNGGADVNVAGPGGTLAGSATLTFTPSNWNTAQTVTVAAVNDTAVEGPETANLTFSASSTDASYNNLAIAPVPVAVTDNDQAVAASVTVTQSGGSTAVTEGGATDTVSVVLSKQPTANVSVTVNGGADVNVAGPGGTLAGSATLTFTPSNWNTAQTVTVSAVNDTLVEGPETANLTFSASSTDASYNNLAIAPVPGRRHR
jgi:hypothetical protein